MDSEATYGLDESFVISDTSSDIGIIESLRFQDRDLTRGREHDRSNRTFATDNAVIRSPAVLHFLSGDRGDLFAGKEEHRARIG